ncbi:TetR/AcrR family transcriptional regulator [Aldersonia sp. NBC_00410]|uniref:TetR/AcrR family transcriptional regulator n=1 Tax=Aldersonia sp. NBC_00410 TaxID=2975954 RepID=UPI00224D760D|nr:TetR/AcrR family transcriptional regulator [Aldersonia sp. NBC_00410]MCX5045616.1 TetR/AcrR family transcriptional regulator [Aldersonia sp. NBC_00410]
MAPPVRTPRHAWVEAGLALLARSGPDAVRIETLAAELGVTRGGFYRQFRSRDELLEAMLDAWERRCVDDVLEQVENEGGDAEQKIRRAGTLTFTEGLMPLDLVVRSWAHRDPAVSARLQRVDNARMEYVRGLLRSMKVAPDDVEAVALLLFSLVIANRLVVADHPGQTRGNVVEHAIRLLLD